LPAAPPLRCAAASPPVEATDGQPAVLVASPNATQDWTDGCIAVTNADMVEIWMMTSDNVRIDIEP